MSTRITGRNIGSIAHVRVAERGQVELRKADPRGIRDAGPVHPAEDRGDDVADDDAEEDRDAPEEPAEEHAEQDAGGQRDRAEQRVLLEVRSTPGARFRPIRATIAPETTGGMSLSIQPVPVACTRKPIPASNTPATNTPAVPG
jgi:hypothetical protein